MALLILSIAVLLLGPLLFVLIRRYELAFWGMDGFVLASVGGLMFLHILPPTFEAAGVGAVIALLAGMVIPMLSESAQGTVARRTDAIFFWVAVAGLMAHAIMDGITLRAQTHAEVSFALALAVILHRLPVALLVWWLLRPQYGKRIASASLLVIAVMTLLGFAIEEQLHGVLDGIGFAMMQAFVAGSLLHVLTHHTPESTLDHSDAQGDHDHEHHHGPDCGCDHDHEHTHSHASPHPIVSTIGVAAGAALVALLPMLESMVGGHSDHGHGHAHDHAHEHAPAVHDHGSFMLAEYGEQLWYLVAESAPALLLGYVLAGIFAAFVPRASMAWMGRGGGLGQATRGMMFGLPIPICSCGVVPLYKSLIDRGVPATAAMAFLIATPELGIEALLLSVPLLGMELTIARLIAAAVVALSIGWLIGRTVAPPKPAFALIRVDVPKSLSQRTKEAAKFGLAEVVDDTAPWILVGLLVAAFISPGSLGETLTGLPMMLEVLLFALVSVPLYVCASGATPLAAALIFAGASPGAAIAFLLAGPASNVTTFGVLSNIHGRKIALLFGVGVITASVVSGVLVNLTIADYVNITETATHEHTGLFRTICAVILGVIVLASLLRVGPRTWVNTVFNFGHHHH